MTAAHDDLIPDEYYGWPGDIQRSYLEELYALYFPRSQVLIGQAPGVTGTTPPIAGPPENGG